MKTDSQFKFEKQALDTALASGSAQVNFPTAGKAVQFRQRCYAFRKWKREILGDQSPYEILTIKALSAGSTTLDIVAKQFEGEIIAGQGEPLAEPPPSMDVVEELELSDEDSDILAEAMRNIHVRP